MNAAISLWLFAITLSADDADKPKVAEKAESAPSPARVAALATAELAHLRAAASVDSVTSIAAYRSLADLCEKAGFPADAESYLEQLAERFPNETFADGKTARAILDQFRARMTAAGRLRQQRADWGDVRRAAIEFQRSVAPSTATRPLYPHAPDLAYFKSLRLLLKKQECVVIDANTGTATWSVELSAPVKDGNEQDGQTSVFCGIGHLFYFIQDDFLYCVSAFDRKALWSRKIESSFPLPVDFKLRSAARVDIVAAAPGIVAVRNRSELVVLDPLTGRQLWLREESQGDDAVIFGDSDYLFLVQPDGSYVALKTADGQVARKGRFPSGYRQGRHPCFGRRMLIIEQDMRKVSVYLWDAWDEREVWRRDFKVRTRHYLNTDYRGDDRYFALVEPVSDPIRPAGKVTLLDFRNGTIALEAQLGCRLDQLSRVDFFSDDDRFYVATEMVGTHLRYTPFTSAVRYVNVNGPLTAYDRATRQKLWELELPNRSVLADPGAELPVIIALESKTTDMQGRISTRTEVYDKKTGKELAAKENAKYLGFTEMAYDATKKTVDLQSWNVSVHIELSDK